MHLKIYFSKLEMLKSYLRLIILQDGFNELSY